MPKSRRASQPSRSSKPSFSPSWQHALSSSSSYTPNLHPTPILFLSLIMGAHARVFVRHALQNVESGHSHDLRECIQAWPHPLHLYLTRLSMSELKILNQVDFWLTSSPLSLSCLVCRNSLLSWARSHGLLQWSQVRKLCKLRCCRSSDGAASGTSWRETCGRPVVCDFVVDSHLFSVYYLAHI